MVLTSAEQVRQIVHESLEDPSVISVFPTETALRFWVEDYVRTHEDGVLRRDRAMAWDTFHGHFLPKSDRAPVNRMIRHLFSLSLLSDEQERTSLRWFRHADPAFDHNNLAPAIEKSLARIGELELLRDQERSSYDRLPAAYRADITFLSHRYRAFLEEKGLFEPLLFSPSLAYVESLRESRYRVFFPKVCDGWARFSRMEPFPGWIEPVRIGQVSRTAALYVYQNELMEMHHALNMIGELLDGGTMAHDIVLTVGNLERWRPYLEHEASLQDVPLSIAGGRPVSRYPAGQFLSGLLDISSHRFSFEAMKSFLLDPRVPWRDPTMARNLVRRAVELSIERGDAHPSQDDWINKLRRSGQKDDDQLLDWYTRLRSLVSALVGSTNAQSVRKALMAVQRMLLSDGLWDAGDESDEGSRVYAFCMHQLHELESALEACGYGSVDHLYSLFMQLLANQTYIPDVRRSGVAVYPYGVSVGICPLHHLVVGTTRDATSVESPRLSLVPDHAWEDSIEEDRTNDFLEHYHIAGTSVRFSAATLLFGNTSALVPSWFVDHDALVEASVDPDILRDCEAYAWRTGDTAGFMPNHRQGEQFGAALVTSLTDVTHDMADCNHSMPIWGRCIDAEGMLSLSSTGIDRFTECPMKWASSYLMRLKKTDYDPIWLDHAAIGIHLHRILERFFRRISEDGKPYAQAGSAEYRQVLDAITTEVFSSYGRSAEAPSGTTMHYILSRYGGQLQQIIEAEAKSFAGYLSIGFEVPLEHTYAEQGFRLQGRVDRILVRNGQDGGKTLAVVDYKKQYSGSKKHYQENPGSMPSHQLPLYAKLLRDTGYGESAESVGIGAFYDIAKGRYHVIWDGTDELLRDTLIEIAEQHIMLMIASLRSGFLGATPSKNACAYCDFRQICRRRYALV